MFSKIKAHYLVNTSDENLVEETKEKDKIKRVKKYKNEHKEDLYKNHKVFNVSLKKKWLLTFFSCTGIKNKGN